MIDNVSAACDKLAMIYFANSANDDVDLGIIASCHGSLFEHTYDGWSVKHIRTVVRNFIHKDLLRTRRSESSRINTYKLIWESLFGD